jgi:hypothetical protein
MLLSTSSPSPTLTRVPLTLVRPLAALSCSDLRQIPDTQEVFLSPDSDVSYIVEILEQVEGDDTSDVARSVPSLESQWSPYDPRELTLHMHSA